MINPSAIKKDWKVLTTDLHLLCLKYKLVYS